jgi:hypothetical protein
MKKDSATPDRVPGFLEPMKAKLVDLIPPGDWIYEIKFDGHRSLALRGGRASAQVRGKQSLLLRSLFVDRIDCQNAFLVSRSARNISLYHSECGHGRNRA